MSILNGHLGPCYAEACFQTHRPMMLKADSDISSPVPNRICSSISYLLCGNQHQSKLLVVCRTIQCDADILQACLHSCMCATNSKQMHVLMCVFHSACMHAVRVCLHVCAHPHTSIEQICLPFSLRPSESKKLYPLVRETQFMP